MGEIDPSWFPAESNGLQSPQTLRTLGTGSKQGQRTIELTLLLGRQTELAQDVGDVFDHQVVLAVGWQAS
jgi:hypothetical protein